MSNLSNMAQGAFVTVAREDEVHEGSMFGVAVGGNAILLSKIGGKIYAMDAVCSHYNGYLPKGQLNTGYLHNGQVKNRAVVCRCTRLSLRLPQGRS